MSRVFEILTAATDKYLANSAKSYEFTRFEKENNRNTNLDIQHALQ